MEKKHGDVPKIDTYMKSWARDRSSIHAEGVNSAPGKYTVQPDLETTKDNLSEVRRRVIEIGSRLLPLETTYPVHLNTELRKAAVTNAGKLVRPCLAVMTAHLMGGDVSTAYYYGWAIELLHLSSLILDDLPAMDNSKFRRGKLTVHVTHGESFAILLARPLPERAQSHAL